MDIKRRKYKRRTKQEETDVQMAPVAYSETLILSLQVLGLLYSSLSPRTLHVSAVERSALAKMQEHQGRKVKLRLSS